MAGNQNSGGYRKPTNPAAVSGPGSLSQRTDGQPTMYIPGMKSLGSTGESTVAQQNGARMYREAANTSVLPNVTPITAPSELPNQSVTDGAPIGKGANELVNLPKPPSEDPDIEMIRNYYPIIQFYASQPGASQSTKDYATYLGTII